MEYEYEKAIFTGQTLEVYRFEKAPKVAKNRNRVRSTANDGGYRPLALRHPDNMRRLKRGFIRLVQTNLVSKGPPSFLTLTFAANADIGVGLRCFREFNLLTKKEFGNSLSYIAVPEFQKRGAIHFHVLLWGLDEKYIKNEKHTRYLQNLWARGYVDIIPTDGSPKLAGYLSKYMQKAMHDERLIGRRAYYNSRNIDRPLLYKIAGVANYPEQILGVGIELLTERSFGTEWLGMGNYKIYKVIENA